MTTPKEELVLRLNLIPDVSVERYQDTDLLGVKFRGKEVAHFQTGAGKDCELDIRLTPAVIKSEGLTVPVETESHPERSENSRWIVQSCRTDDDLDRMVRLVEIAIEVR